jgi:hypothetical protein
LALAALVVVVSGFISSGRASPASACCLPTVPETYECMEDRRLYLDAMDLAAYNMLFPGDAYFGLPRLETGLRGARSSTEPAIPSILLKSIGWIESVITQASRQIPFGGIGPALISFDCGHGIMQVTSGMTTPLGDGGVASPEQLMVATHFAYNIARGAVILVDKWNAAPENRPIAGTDTNGDPSLVENWYFAVWSYNGFTGPGANRSNHPMDPIYGGWPRVPYSCGPSADGFGHNRSKYPYQELVWGCAAHPPVVQGATLWQPLDISYPDLNDPRFSTPLSLINFVFPYAQMDVPTPNSPHQDPTPKPPSSLLSQIVGAPRMGVSANSIRLAVSEERTVDSQELVISNLGSGILSWMAVPSASWLKVTPQAGVAIDSALACAPDAPCNRAVRVAVSVDPALLSGGTQTATLRIISPATDETATVTVSVVSIVKMGVPGVTRN